MGLVEALGDTLWPRSSAVAECVQEICREDGWDIRCTLGSEAAQGLRSRAEDKTGAPVAKAMQNVTCGDVGLEITVAFELEPGSDPGSRLRSQGTVVLVGTSRYLSTAMATGDWKVTSRDDDDVPTAIRWRLHCSELVVGGSILVPQGPVYFNAFTTAERRQRGLDVGSGRVTVREDSSVLSALFGTRGLIEEFKTVGRFEISPRSPA